MLIPRLLAHLIEPQSSSHRGSRAPPNPDPDGMPGTPDIPRRSVVIPEPLEDVRCSAMNVTYPRRLTASVRQLVGRAALQLQWIISFVCWKLYCSGDTEMRLHSIGFVSPGGGYRRNVTAMSTFFASSWREIEFMALLLLPFVFGE